MAEHSPYRLSISLNVLRHLGIGLYSNIPAVISEVVANAWDADASEVTINLDVNKKEITIKDNGCGMCKADINGKYLNVGYSRRTSENPVTAERKRHVMGRKGIGKLSLFSIADVIEVQSVKKQNGALEKSGFVMRASDIEEAIKGDEDGVYEPPSIDESTIEIKKGTLITLRGLKPDISKAEPFLRRRLARRFSIIGAEQDFNVIVNDKEIGIEDRDYFKQMQYVWYFGEEGKRCAALCTNAKDERKIELDGTADAEKGYKISGWIGTVKEQKHIDETNNTIVILAWGKLIHEDLLKDLKEAGMYAQYLMGELRADFLDSDNEPDITTSGRQSLKETDDRFELLKQHVQEKILKPIQSKWTEFRNIDGTEAATADPAIKEWFDVLSPDHKKYAQVLFGKINQFPVPNKSELYKHGIIAFETLALKQSLSKLDEISATDPELFRSVFSDLDALEEAHYYQIVKSRMAVLSKFEDIVDNNAKERIIQEHIFDHLWLLDPSWERASTNKRIEEKVTTEFAEISAKLSDEERDGRIDIRYKTAAGKHIIVELKRYQRQVTVFELAEQVSKYRQALDKCLQEHFPQESRNIECICIVGSQPGPKDEPQVVEETLRAVRARYITYDDLIKQTQESYKDYLEASRKINKLREIIEKIDQGKDDQ